MALLLFCPLVRIKTFAIKFEWLVIELSYFTYVFLVIRPFSSVLRSRSSVELKVRYQGHIFFVLNGRYGGSSCSQTQLVLIIIVFLRRKLQNFDLRNRSESFFSVPRKTMEICVSINSFLFYVLPCLEIKKSAISQGSKQSKSSRDKSNDKGILIVLDQVCM